MNSRPAGSFATLLMSGPLVAIPLMAMFGVPEFASLSKLIEEDSAEVSEQVEVGPDTDVIVSSEETVADGVTPLNDPARPPRDVNLPTSNREPRFASLLEKPHAGDPVASALSSPKKPIESVDPQPLLADPPSAPPGTAVAATDATWETAAQRLQQLGIDDYRLERGHNGDSFLFICQFAPGTDARIVRRFEAEAANAGDAIQKVLTQIDKWRQHSSSFAQSR